MKLEILILIGTAIILFVVLIRIYPILYISLSKLIFGKYSSRYIATCKRFTGQSPYPYCIKDDFINHIAGFYKNQEKVLKLNSALEITFLESDYGLGFYEILRTSEKPFCINSNRLPEFDLKVLGYKDVMFTTEMKKYYFFMNKTFFLGQLTFKNPTKENIDRIIGVIRKKYLDLQPLDSDSFLISGKNNTQLWCHYNGFHLSLSYLSRSNDEISNLVDQHWQSSTKLPVANVPSLEDELMEKL
ncbi:MAG: hypothetical protein K9H16_08450 [Bacteroidales bacterium]|nr:hypothetical protein [Bacteroidales bacterium]